MHHYSIGVKAQDGTVWLNGTVRNQQQLRTALEIVGEHAGRRAGCQRPEVTGADASVRPANAQASDGRLSIGSQADYEAPVASAMPYGGSGTGSGVPLAMGGVRMAMMQPGDARCRAKGTWRTRFRPTPRASAAELPRPTSIVRSMPGYAWPSYASYPNYAGITYPRQYSPTAWPFIGPFYPYPQVPLGWRKVTLEWHNGWWKLDFKDWRVQLSHKWRVATLNRE